MRSLRSIQSWSRAIAFGVCLTCILLGVSCTKKDDLDLPEEEYPDYIIFGRYTQSTWCSGETCIETFKIGPNGLYEDSSDILPSADAFSNGNFEWKLSSTDYTSIIDVFKSKNYEPLFEITDATVGTLLPDNFHFYFEYKSKSIHRAWLIDATFDGSVPQSLQSLLNDLNVAVQIAQF
jgi:hypothetical protein